MDFKHYWGETQCHKELIFLDGELVFYDSNTIENGSFFKKKKREWQVFSFLKGNTPNSASIPEILMYCVPLYCVLLGGLTTTIDPGAWWFEATSCCRAWGFSFILPSISLQALAMLRLSPIFTRVGWAFTSVIPSSFHENTNFFLFYTQTDIQTVQGPPFYKQVSTSWGQCQNFIKYIYINWLSTSM